MLTDHRPIVALAALLAIAAGTARAQQLEVAPAAAPGWTFTPGLNISGVYDSNVALADAPATSGQTESDRLFMIQPFGQITFRSPRTTLTGGYTGSLRRYTTVDQLNGYDQRFSGSLRRLVSRRVTLSVSNSFTDVPTTDEVELNGVPFSRTGTRTNTFTAGVTARLTRFTDLSAGYDNTWVAFDRDESAGTFLLGGVVNGARVGLSRRLGERLSIGGEYSLKLADLNEGARNLTFHNVGGTVNYQVGPHLALSAAAGLSRLVDQELDSTRSGPFVRVNLLHSTPRLIAGATFERSFVPSFGFGGSNQNQELSGFVQMPVVRNRLYVSGSAAWRRSDPFVETELELDTIWIRSTVGYAATRWLRVEGFHAFTRQDSVVTGGEINRQRLGAQVVISQPMRIR